MDKPNSQNNKKKNVDINFKQVLPGSTDKNNNNNNDKDNDNSNLNPLPNEVNNLNLDDADGELFDSFTYLNKCSKKAQMDVKK